MQDHIQEVLDKLCECAKSWDMEFNVKKCKVLHTGNNDPRHVYKMEGQDLLETEEEVDLGGTMTRNLKPAAQCQKVARMAMAVLGQITRLFHYRDRLYCQYVRLHLEFAGPAWSLWQEGDKACLERVQRKAVAKVSGLAARLLGEAAGAGYVKEQRHQTDIAQVYKILTGKDSVDKEALFTMANSHGRSTQTADEPLSLRQGSAWLEVRKNFFTQRVVPHWNRVPGEIKTRNLYRPSRMLTEN